MLLGSQSPYNNKIGIYSTTNNNNSNYGTLKNQSNILAGFEANIPRILVIPRGSKGFGFILRGANRKNFLSKKKYFIGLCFSGLYLIFRYGT